jgi:hypothetical protein
MTIRRLIPSVLTLALVFGAAGAITHRAKFVTAAPAAPAGGHLAKEIVYDGKTLVRAAKALQGSAGLVGRGRPETARSEPVPDSKPATPDMRPDRGPEPDAVPRPVLETPPAMRREPSPAPRAKEPPPAEKPVIVRNDRPRPGRPLLA